MERSKLYPALARAFQGKDSIGDRPLDETCSSSRESGTDNELEALVRIQPNVSQGIFTLDYNTLFDEKGGRLVITNTQGVTVLDQAIAQGIKAQKIDLRGSESGIYFVQIQNGSENIPAQRIIIQK